MFCDYILFFFPAIYFMLYLRVSILKMYNTLVLIWLIIDIDCNFKHKTIVEWGLLVQIILNSSLDKGTILDIRTFRHIRDSVDSRRSQKKNPLYLRGWNKSKNHASCKNLCLNLCIICIYTIQYVQITLEFGYMYKMPLFD